MKYTVLILAAAGAVLAGCASSPAPQQPLQPVITDSAGSAIAIPTNSIETQARNANQQPYWRPWGLHDQY